ncbi:uncharacterized protein AC631_05741 [Debaryomyces fabryi]|uniref:Uncharacterized protein n=1 Tax=Debaryomyces fabryi TaxID=58627 RepID=A0A0V1PQG5_9ASCO|nr:uncharacterized protein AC631_05741 [Debaryomyces fabryi]KRZ98501.1 hypothetical protein AC631_05741 [Debaryomyces fabryi]CUM57533.1 unnamed protein product [Debaryomyces fabryi]
MLNHTGLVGNGSDQDKQRAKDIAISDLTRSGVVDVDVIGVAFRRFNGSTDLQSITWRNQSALSLRSIKYLTTLFTVWALGLTTNYALRSFQGTNEWKCHLSLDDDGDIPEEFYGYAGEMACTACFYTNPDCYGPGYKGYEFYYDEEYKMADIGSYDSVYVKCRQGTSGPPSHHDCPGATSAAELGSIYYGYD